MFWVGAPLPVHTVCPWMVRLAGTVLYSGVVQVQVPGGMITVPPLTAELSAACTSDAEHEAAVIVGPVLARACPGDMMDNAMKTKTKTRKEL